MLRRLRESRHGTEIAGLNAVSTPTDLRSYPVSVPARARRGLHVVLPLPIQEMSMKTPIALGTVVAALAVLSQTALPKRRPRSAVNSVRPKRPG